ncbi:MAG: NADH:flavin oxidoreductase [Thermoprotei archaeon]|nr:MAG: NADH:flavin oxidoreductase [Thermoprotei archaeon]
MPTLLDPIEIRGHVIRNRLVLPPMGTGLAGPRGEVTDELIKHYDVRSRCNGLVIVEHSYVSPRGKVTENQLGIWSDDLIPGLARLAKTIKGRGAVAVIQLNHGGGKANPELVGTPIAPSSVPVPGFEWVPREITREEIDEVVEEFVEAARRAIEAGFDGVEIHGAHGYLLSEFLSPITNKRRDEYGGPLENRMRLPLRIVERVRRVIGSGKLLLYRMGVTDAMEGGFTVEEAEVFAARLVERGVDVIDVSGGLCGAELPGKENVQGYFVPYAERIRRRVKAPVIGVGGVRDPLFANRVIEEGRIDLIAVGRAQLEDAEWACRALEAVKKYLGGRR